MSRLGLTSDWHAGKSADLLSAQYGPGSRLDDLAAVLERQAEIFEAENVDAICFLGDATDQPRPRPWELLVVQKAFARFDSIAPTVGISGNAHDVVSADLPLALDLLRDYVRLATTPQIVPLDGITLACLPWVSTAQIKARHATSDVDVTNEYAAELLIRVAEGMRDQIDGPTVLMLHFTVSGDADGIAQFAREPVLPLEALEAIGFDAVVCGHLHRPQLLSPEPRPVLYTGSPMPLSFGEAGYPHGVWVVDVEPGDTHARFVEVPSRRFVTVDLDDSAWHDVDGAIVRCRYTATEDEARSIDPRQIERDLVAAGAARVFIEATVERAARARVQVTESIDDHEALRLYLESLGLEGEQLARVLDRGQRYLEQVPA